MMLMEILLSLFENLVQDIVTNLRTTEFRGEDDGVKSIMRIVRASIGCFGMFQCLGKIALRQVERREDVEMLGEATTNGTQDEP